ncbi:MAG: hypothetical protein OEZ02_10360 [Anaerolineae bacterium]|nr:hypothetical protein [Anaerolineae bacterium]
MTLEKIEELGFFLYETQKNHHTYQVENLTGDANIEWAGWYANFMLENGLNDRFGLAYNQQGLTRFLQDADNEFRSEEREERWSVFYARKMLDN